MTDSTTPDQTDEHVPTNATGQPQAGDPAKDPGGAPAEGAGAGPADQGTEADAEHLTEDLGDPDERGDDLLRRDAPGDDAAAPLGATEAAQPAVTPAAAAETADALESIVATETPSGGEAARGRSSRIKQLEREGEVAADFLETLLDIADLDGDIDVDVDGDRAAVAIVDSEDGRVPRRLVGEDGKVLEALQELTRLAVQVETGDRTRLMLDIAGHRAARRSALVEHARRVIEQVHASGAPRELEPMSAFERKVVHDEVAAAGLVSESKGEDPNRYIVIRPE